MRRSIGFLFSGEHPRLPPAEALAVVESESGASDPLLWRSRVLLARSETPSIGRLSSRLAFTKKIFEAYSLALSNDLRPLLEVIPVPPMSGVSFRVRAVSLGGGLDARVAERVLGGRVLRAGSGLRVDLEDPDVEILCLMLPRLLIIGQTLSSIDRSRFRLRETSMRPFFHPTSMNPILARAMVNLARVREGSLVLDPFMGAGGIVLEALCVGARVIGVDADPDMVAGALQNLSFYGFFRGYSLMVANAVELSLDEKVDAIVTDPPYGRGARVLGFREPRSLLERFIERSPDLLREGGWISISVPDRIGVEALMEEAGYSVRGVYFIKVHKRLRRKIVVGRLDYAGDLPGDLERRPYQASERDLYSGLV
ncbi:MAG: hypothetical protein DRO06_00400 [Thermoproteota archaeon]|nr:MAG: hypothetical protein DRO06_00400 [Candidatus Korarchaeota archaeon]